jgi:CRISPR-associated endonuclease/helicase Cas3
MAGALYRYWGKSQANKESVPAYHLLPYHCLDVAAVAARWWHASSAIRRAFCCRGDATEEAIKAWVIFFIALHDIGKFDVRFQLKVKVLWRLLYPEAGTYGSLPSVIDCVTYRHGQCGLFWFREDNRKTFGADTDGLEFLSDTGEGDFEADWLEAWKPWIEAVTGHHGHILRTECAPNSELSPSCSKELAPVDRNARIEWVSAIEKIFLHPVGLSAEMRPPKCSPLLAGFCSVADWLGSRCDHENFSYRPDPVDLQQYFEDRVEQDADRVLALSGLIGSPRVYSGVAALLEPSQQARSLQTLVDKLPVKPGMTLVEAPTGSGKTEAAVAYAWRLIEAGFADSLVFALPTQATANGMLARLERMAPILFKEHPNLLLAHGSARFNERFAALKHAGLGEHEQEDGWVQCREWLAESRKRIFLGQIGVCTVDQVLISVLPVKHRFVRSFGAGRGVLLVDEVHAYDTYMYGLLEEVLRQQRLSGGSAILLSATLSKSQRNQLLGAWGADAACVKRNAPYPLITWASDLQTKTFTLGESQQPAPFIVALEPVIVEDLLPDDALIGRIVVAAEGGAQVAIVCNLVDNAQALARRLRERTGVPVDLFHARFCYKDRQAKELKVMDFFGPRGNRETGRILVATQVVEQSLDLDFDWLITQLCPIDLLFQRMGRLHRHSRPRRPTGFERPCCTILLPEGSDYGLHGFIYANARVLWRTAQMLLTAPGGEVVFPEAYRTWIESVYCEEPWGSEPENVEKQYEKFLADVFIKRHKARAILNTAANPFGDTDVFVTAVTRDGDMNLTLVPYFAARGGRKLLDGTVLESLDKYQQLEALALNSIGVPSSWHGFLDEPDENRRFWLETKREGEVFTANRKGVIFSYHKETGLEMKK